jgi:serine/threonine protein kinase
MVQREGRLDSRAVARIGYQIAMGLNLAHQNSLFHGLLKPSNVLIGQGNQVQILDFGIGSLLAENEGESLVDTMSTANALTSGLDCTSPESIMEPTNRTPAGDQYSLGCVLYYCLAGCYPFAEGSAVEKMMAHQFKQPTSLTELVDDAQPELVAIIDRLMQKKPDDRFPAMDEVVQALNRFVESPSLNMKRPSSIITPPAPAKDNVPPVESEVFSPPLAREAFPVPHEREEKPPALPNLPPVVFPAKLEETSIPDVIPAEPVPAKPAPPPMRVPTRKSLRDSSAGLPPTPPVITKRQMAPVSCSSFSLSAPLSPSTLDELRPSAANGLTPVNLNEDPRRDSQPPGLYPEPKSVMGPLGYLVLGMTVAVVCFLAVHTFLK